MTLTRHLSLTPLFGEAHQGVDGEYLENTLERLDTLTQEEASMASAVLPKEV
jgi:hypothetical protein